MNPPLEAQRPALTERFQLVDHNGTPCDRASFAGQHLLIYFGFTHCKLVCPTSLAKLSRVLELLDRQAASVTPLYISVDPKRDTPEVMRCYLQSNYPRFTGLTGSEADIERVKEDFRVFAGYRVDPDDPEGYERPHTAFSYLLDGTGQYLQHFSETRSAEQIASAIASIRQAEAVPVSSSALGH